MVNGKLDPVLNKVPHHEDVSCAYSDTKSWRCNGGVEVQLQALLISVLDGGEW